MERVITRVIQTIKHVRILVDIVLNRVLSVRWSQWSHSFADVPTGWDIHSTIFL